MHFHGAGLFRTGCGFKNADAFCPRGKSFPREAKGHPVLISRTPSALRCLLSPDTEGWAGIWIRAVWNATAGRPDCIAVIFLPVTLRENALEVWEEASGGEGTAPGLPMAMWSPHLVQGGMATICISSLHVDWTCSCLVLHDRCLNGKLAEPYAFTSHCPGWKTLVICPRREISVKPPDIKP